MCGHKILVKLQTSGVICRKQVCGSLIIDENKGKGIYHKAGKVNASFLSQVWLLQWTKLQCSIDLTEPLLQSVSKWLQMISVLQNKAKFWKRQPPVLVCLCCDSNSYDDMHLSLVFLGKAERDVCIQLPTVSSEQNSPYPSGFTMFPHFTIRLLLVLITDS